MLCWQNHLVIQNDAMIKTAVLDRQHDDQAKVKTRRVPLLLPPKRDRDWPSGRDVQISAPTFIRMRHSSYTTTSAIHHDAPSCCMMMLVRSKTLLLVCRRRSWRNLQHHIRYWLHCRPSWKQQVATAATVFSFFFPFFLFSCRNRKIISSAAAEEFFFD